MKDKIGVYSSWLVFSLYFVLLCFGLWHHELWGDELHSWNIAKNSDSFSQLFSNIRYEGHPPLWYVLLRIASWFTDSPKVMQLFQLILSSSIAYLFIFKFRLPLYLAVILVIGYYFSFEYAVLSRNYAIAILPALLICKLYSRDIKYKSHLYLFLLFILSCTHLVGLILALAIHLSLGYKFYEKRRSDKILFVLFGLILLLPASIFIVPPSDSILGLDFWKKIWTNEQYLVSGQAVIKAFGPLPLWHESHLWNTNYFVDSLKDVTNLKLKSWIISVLIVVLVSAPLFKYKTAFRFFILNVILTWLLAIFFPLSNARYVGFIFIGYVFAICLLYQNERPELLKSIIICLILLVQVPGAYIMLKQDAQRPFAMSREVKDVVAQAPGTVLTDYWTLNYLTAMTGKAFFVVGYNQERNFILWDTTIGKVMKNKRLYSEGLEFYRKTHPAEKLFLLSNNSLDQIFAKDSAFVTHNKIKLLFEKTGSIDKYSDLHLYEIESK